MRYNDKDYSSIDMLQKGGKRKIIRDESVIPHKIKQAYTKCISISEVERKKLLIR